MTLRHVANHELVELLLVEAGTKAGISKRDPSDTLGIEDKRAAKQRLAVVHTQLTALHERLYADGRHSVVLVLQGLDASGKDGVIRTVFTGLNPQGCRVVSFKAPTSTELAHDYLWRVHAALPVRGDHRRLQPLALRGRRHCPHARRSRPRRSGARRSRAHPRVGADALRGGHVDRQGVPARLEGRAAAALQERVDDPEKRWKFRLDDLEVRKR